MRRYLDDQGFIEVETPVLQPRYGGAFARPFVTHHNELDADLYLRIATELYLKRLIVGGLERVYEIGKDFRNEGVSFKHNPEFTMLEWYEAYADYRDTMDRIEQLVEHVAREVLGTTDGRVPWPRGRPRGAVDAGQVRRGPRAARALDARRGRAPRVARPRRVSTPNADKDWTQLIDHAFSHFVEPGLISPTIVYDYPVELSPFARATDDDPTLTERFEYFAGGMELGNAFSEINDAATQAARFEMQTEQVDGERGRSGLRRGALVRDAADRRARLRHRPVRDAAHRQGDDPRRVLFPALRQRDGLAPGSGRERSQRLRSNAMTSSRMSSSVRVGSQPIAAVILSIAGIRWSMSSIPWP